MPKFLTTAGATYHIEDIILNAKKSITLITPYLKLSQTLAERLVDADKAGVKITLIYGKEELRTDQKQILFKLNNLEIYFFENLHAKCYFNEDSLVLSSMNLYETSQTKNREMGVLFNSIDDESMYDDAIKEAISIKNSSQLKKSFIERSSEVAQEQKIEIKPEAISASNLEYLKESFQYVSIEQVVIEGKTTTALIDYPFVGVQTHINGTIDLIFYTDDMIRKFEWLKRSAKDELANKLNSQRVFWNEKWRRSVISIYDIPKEINNRITIIKQVSDILNKYY